MMEVDKHSCPYPNGSGHLKITKKCKFESTFHKNYYLFLEELLDEMDEIRLNTAAHALEKQEAEKRSTPSPTSTLSGSVMLSSSSSSSTINGSINV